MLDKLKKYCRDHKGKGKLVVVVGYSQEYALKVHERTDIPHKVGQSKYLETAARSSESTVRDSVRKAKPDELVEVLLKSGLLIQRESQKLCPVDTSALRASAFTTIEEELDKVATEARTKAEMIRASVLAQRIAKKASK